jgi:hypothetical protein
MADNSQAIEAASASGYYGCALPSRCPRCCAEPHSLEKNRCEGARPGYDTSMADPAYVSKVRIERLGGPQRLAYLPAESEPVAFGVHSDVAEHYGVDADQFPPHAATLDYVVAAAAG